MFRDIASAEPLRMSELERGLGRTTGQVLLLVLVGVLGDWRA